MTIATRNRFIRLATLCAIAFLLMSAISVVLTVMHRSLPATPPGNRPIPLLDGWILTRYSPLASICAIAVFPALALAGLGYIMFAFEKTQTVEITFFAAAVFALSIESVRLFIPLYELWINAGFFAVTISRVVFFCRIFALLALLASGLFANTQTIQQIGPSIFLLAFFSFSLANSIPINSAGMESNFLVSAGYSAVLDLFFMLIGLLSTLSYLILGLTRGVKEYRAGALGILVLLVGYTLLLSCDSWVFLVAGTLLCANGAWLYLDRMHRYYLWQ